MSSLEVCQSKRRNSPTEEKCRHISRSAAFVIIAAAGANGSNSNSGNMEHINLEFLDAERKDPLKLQEAENSGPSPSAKDPQLNAASCDALGGKKVLSCCL